MIFILLVFKIYEGNNRIRYTVNDRSVATYLKKEKTIGLLFLIFLRLVHAIVAFFFFFFLFSFSFFLFFFFFFFFKKGRRKARHPPHHHPSIPQLRSKAIAHLVLGSELCVVERWGCGLLGCVAQGGGSCSMLLLVEGQGDAGCVMRDAGRGCSF